MCGGRHYVVVVFLLKNCFFRLDAAIIIVIIAAAALQRRERERELRLKIDRPKVLAKNRNE